MLALIVFVALDLTLTAIAIGVSLRRRRRAATVGATALVSAATVLGTALVWLLWTVAPACITDPNVLGCTAGRAGVGAFVPIADIALLGWAWMSGVAMVARSMHSSAGVRS